MTSFFEVAEGRKEICALCRVSSWQTIITRRRKKPGFNSLIRRNPSNGKPYIVIEEYRKYQTEFNENR